MIPEIGSFALILALSFALLLVIIPTIGIFKNDPKLMVTASMYTIGQFIFISIAFLCLVLSFLNNDFSVIYVLSNSSIKLPFFYKLCAAWGGHEGSMLLWVLILSFWMLAVNFFSRSLPQPFRIRVLITLGFLSVGFILFLLATSNPFLRQFQILDSPGRDLNPLLQDPGFLFHPPMLYMGYVGFAIAFAFAIAALWTGHIESAWAKWTRPWTLAAWCCLTVGITLGSWWAYRELGWGGWWFWDPVENASFMPWLVGTALIHSLAVCERREQLKAWTVLLAIIAFSLSLVGTFLVRSGVLTSVHAFAVDPLRGSYILALLFIVIGGSLLLFALRAHTVSSVGQFYIFSKESSLLLNNVFLSVAMATVLLGTIYPLFIDALGLGKLSVGAPYFNRVFIPLVLPLFFLMGVGIHLHWQKDQWKKVIVELRYIFLYCVLLTTLILALSRQGIRIEVWLGMFFALWIIFSSIKLVRLRLKKQGFRALKRNFWGMITAHCGMAVTILGIAISSEYGTEADIKLALGESYQLGTYQIKFLDEKPIQGSNYQGTQAQFQISKHNYSKFIYPEKRIYELGQIAMTESAIDVSAFRDIYVALGEPIVATQSLGGNRQGTSHRQSLIRPAGKPLAWVVRIYYKPLIRWIWGGGFLILLGGLLALSDKRYYSEALQVKT